MDLNALLLQKARLKGRGFTARRKGNASAGTHDAMPRQGQIIRRGTQSKTDEAGPAG
jgi:hypothetical protein